MPNESHKVRQMLEVSGLPATFTDLPLLRATDKDWDVLSAGDYDGRSLPGTVSAAEAYYQTASHEGALPLNQFIEWPGMMAAIIDELRQKSAPVVFEIGGGNGRQIKEVIQQFRPRQTVFIENSRKMIELAQANLGDTQVTWIHASAEEGLTQLEDNHFDLGFASLVLHYLEPGQLALFYLRLAAVLKSDGAFLFTSGTQEFNEFLHPKMSRSALRNSAWYMFDIAGNPVWEMQAYTYFPEDHESLASQAGLQISRQVLKPQLPPSVNPESLQPISDLLHSPVWNLYRVSRVGV